MTGARLRTSGGRYLAGGVVAGVVLTSAAVRYVAQRSFEAPWIAPDEMVYGLIGRSFWGTGRFVLLGTSAPFYGLYPVFAGLPAALLGTGAGVTMLQAVQALLVSATAAIVYAWVHRSAGARWALTAAVLVVLMPALAYSGLMMTEAAFLPAATFALWLLARALERPSRGRQLALLAAILLAIAVRLQGVVLVPVMVTAIGLAAWFGRDLLLVRRFAPVLVSLASLALIWIGFQVFAGSSGKSVFGAYGATASSGYESVEVARWVFRHAGDLFLLVVGAPLVAMLILAYEAVRGRERDPQVRALVAVTLSASVWLTLQVGAFASRYVGQLAERDLIAVAPALFACFAIWMSRGMPRPQPATAIVAALVAVPAVLLPVKTLVTPNAAPDALMTVPLDRILGWTSPSTLQTSWVVFAAALIVLTVTLPRRAALVLPVLLAVALAASSVLATREIAKRALSDRTNFFGGAPTTWVDQSATGRVTYLYDGNPFWNAVWQTAFWNERIVAIATLPGAPPGSLPATLVSPRFDGKLFDIRGGAIRGRELVASTAFTFFGTVLAEIRQQDVEQAGLRLWRTSGPPRMSTSTTGLRPNGDIQEPVQINVYACGHGRLELTLLGKQGTPVEIDLDGVRQLTVTPLPGGVWSGSVPAPRDADGTTRCTYEIRSPGLVGSTRIEFVRS